MRGTHRVHRRPHDPRCPIRTSPHGPRAVPDRRRARGGTAAGCANARGIPAASVEIGGPYFPAGMTAAFSTVMLRGLHNVLRLLGMEPGDPDLPAEQWYFTRKDRVEANPTQGG